MAIYQISLRIVWNSNDFVDTPENVIIKFTNEQLHNLRKHILYSMKHGVTVSVPHDDITYFDDDNVEPRFRSNVQNICIVGNTCYYYAQSKYDSSIQIESEPFPVTLKNNTFTLTYRKNKP